MARHAWRLFLQQRDFRNEDTPAMATFSAKVFRLQKSRTAPTCLVRQLKATCFCQFCSSFTHHLSWLATRDLHHPANCYLPCTPSQLTTCLLASYSSLCVCQSLFSRKGAMLHDPKSWPINRKKREAKRVGSWRVRREKKAAKSLFFFLKKEKRATRGWKLGEQLENFFNVCLCAFTGHFLVIHFGF